MKYPLFILLFFFFRLGLSQGSLEMVPNGDFSKIDNWNIPPKLWKEKFKDKCQCNPYPVPNCDYTNYKDFKVKDIYGFYGVGPSRGYNLVKYVYATNAIHLITDWYPYRDAKKNSLNFDSVVHQDTFYFYRKDQYEYPRNYYPTFHNKTKLRICGKNLYSPAAKLNFQTKVGAYYSLKLNIQYDIRTYIGTVYTKGYFDNIETFIVKYPDLVDIRYYDRTRSGYPYQKQPAIDNWCNISLDSNVYARNNNFKITLLNKYLIDSSSQNTPLMEQDIWKMPLFEETEKEVPFNHVFKANATFSWIQLRQRHPDSVSYYPNDTLAFPTNNDSLLSFLTLGGNYNHDYQMPDQLRFHPNLGNWPYVKQWFYPGKLRRYADQALRNADYFLDNLSIKPQLYRNTEIAAPSTLCVADTFLAFLPSGETAVWTDLLTGKVISQSDSCWVFLNNQVLIEVKGENFIDTLKYSLTKPQSPFQKDTFNLCPGDSLNFTAPSGFEARWQFGAVHSPQYTHRFADSTTLQATFISELGCNFHFQANIIKGRADHIFSIDTTLCNQSSFLWDIPSEKWIFSSNPSTPTSQISNSLIISTQADINERWFFIDTATQCSISLNVKILSNSIPKLSSSFDTVVCSSHNIQLSVPVANWYLLNQEKSMPPLILDSAGTYELIVGNRTCTDTQIIGVSKYPEIEAKFQQSNPWTCYLDSTLNFSASPGSYQYFWQRSATSTADYSTQDTQLIEIIVVDSHGCKRSFNISPEYACYKPVWIPNAFTPNGNGPELNEVFKPHCISCQTTYMKIFNRWGELIHSSPEPWDGTYQGVAVPEGVYIYLMGIEITYGTQTRKQHFSGNVQVVGGR